MNGNEGDADAWRDRSGQMYLTPKSILEWLQDVEVSTPMDIAESRRRENVVRLQCRELVSADLVVEVCHDTYTLSNKGREYLAEQKSPRADNTLNIENLGDSSDDEWRIRDLSQLDAVDIKITNEREFFEDPDNDYGWVEGSRELTRRRIRNVKESRLNRLMREFPCNESVTQQCAHWMRAFAGLHFFPDANHRTGMATLQALLDLNGISYPQWPGPGIERVVLRSKLARYLLVDIRFNTLWKHDEHYMLWHRYFRNLFYEVNNRCSPAPSTEVLRNVLNFARERRQK